MAESPTTRFCFGMHSKRAPMHDGVTLKEQVDFMISEAKAEKGHVAAARSETARNRRSWSGEHGRPPTNPPEEGKPRRLNEIRER